MNDLIERDKAVDAIAEFFSKTSYTSSMSYSATAAFILAKVPSAEEEVKPITYEDCQFALLRMWMDKVVTDGEYYRIVDRLNAKKEEWDG